MADPARLIIGGAAVGASFVPFLSPVGPALFAFGANMALGAFQKRRRLAERTEGFRLNLASTLATLPVVYGEATVGGAVSFRDSVQIEDPDKGDPDFKIERMCIVFSLGLGSTDGTGIQSISQVFLDGKLAITTPLHNVPFSTAGVSNDFLVGTSTRRLAYSAYRGSSTQVTDTKLTELFPAWTAPDHAGPYVAYMVLFMDWDERVWSTGFRELTADIRGVKVYDPRVTSTVWSDNPALCIRDYLTSKLYGRGVDPTRLDEQSFIDAANYCDELVTVPDGQGGNTTQKRFTCNGVLDTGQSHRQNLEALESSCRGRLILQGDTYRLVIRRPVVVSGIDIGPDQITGELRVFRRGINGTANLGRATFVDADRGQQPQVRVWPRPEDTNQLLINDGGFLNAKEVDLDFTTDQYMAEQILQTLVRESRADLGVVFEGTEELINTQIGDVVTFSHPDSGITDKEMWVARVSIPPGPMARPTLQLEEYDANAYSTDPLDQKDEPPVTGPANPNQIEPAQPPLVLTSDASTSLLTQDGIRQPRILVQWGASPGPYLDRYRLRWKPNTASEWSQMDVPRDQKQEYIGGVGEGVLYDVEVIAVNHIGTISEPLAGQVTVDTQPSEFALAINEMDFRIDGAGVGSADIVVGPGVASLRWIAQIGTPPTQAEVEASTNIAVPDADGLIQLENLGPYEAGQTVHLGAIGYELAGGLGLQTVYRVTRAEAPGRPLGRPPNYRIRVTTSGDDGTVEVYVEDQDDTLTGVWFEDEPVPSGTYTEDPVGALQPDRTRMYSKTYDISGGPVSPRVQIRYDPGPGERIITETVLVQPNPLPELTTPFGSIQSPTGELFISATTDADTVEWYWAARTDREPTDAEVLAEPANPAPGGGGTVQEENTDIFPAIGETWFVKFIPTEDSGANPGASVTIPVSRDPCEPGFRNVSGGWRARDQVVLVGFHGRGVCTKSAAYVASKTNMPADDEATILQARVITWGNHSHLGGANPEVGGYFGSIGGGFAPPVRDVEGNELTLHTSQDQIFIRIWPFNALQYRDDGGGLTVDHTKLGPPGESEEIVIGPVDRSPLGRIDPDLDAYGNMRLNFIGMRNARSVAYKIAHFNGQWRDPNIVIPDDPTNPDGVLNLDFEADDKWKTALGSAFVDITTDPGYTYVRAWFYNEEDAAGEVGPSEVTTPEYRNTPTVELHGTYPSFDPANPGVIDLSIVVGDRIGAKHRVRLWVNKANANDADPTGPPDGYVDLTAPLTTLNAATVWELTGGGQGNLLDAIPFSHQQPKTCYIELQSLTDAGAVIGTSFVDPFTITQGQVVVDEDGNLNPGAQWPDATPLQNTKDDAALGGSLGDSPGILIEDIQNAGNGWLPDDSDINIGTPAVPSTLAREQPVSALTMRGTMQDNPSGGYRQLEDATQRDGVYHEDWTPMPLAVDSTLKGASVEVRFSGTGPEPAAIKLEIRKSPAGGGPLVLASQEWTTTTLAVGIWHLVTLSVNETVEAGANYTLFVSLKALTDGGSNTYDAQYRTVVPLRDIRSVLQQS